MSLYYLQKIIYDINRDPSKQQEYINAPEQLLSNYQLDEQEQQALLEPDIGLLYVLGVNGQILMHFAAFHQIAWNDYLEAMRTGVTKHGQVKAGVYAMTGSGKNFTIDSEVSQPKESQPC